MVGPALHPVLAMVWLVVLSIAMVGVGFLVAWRVARPRRSLPTSEAIQGHLPDGLPALGIPEGAHVFVWADQRRYAFYVERRPGRVVRGQAGDADAVAAILEALQPAARARIDRASPSDSTRPLKIVRDDH